MFGKKKSGTSPEKATVTVTALELCDPKYIGRPVVEPHFEGDVAWRQARRNLGRTPEVKSCEYERNGEGGEPTVYLVLTGWKKPGTYCLRPGDRLTVEAD